MDAVEKISPREKTASDLSADSETIALQLEEAKKKDAHNESFSAVEAAVWKLLPAINDSLARVEQNLEKLISTSLGTLIERQSQLAAESAVNGRQRSGSCVSVEEGCMSADSTELAPRTTSRSARSAKGSVRSSSSAMYSSCHSKPKNYHRSQTSPSFSSDGIVSILTSDSRKLANRRVSLAMLEKMNDYDIIQEEPFGVNNTVSTASRPSGASRTSASITVINTGSSGWQSGRHKAEEDSLGFQQFLTPSDGTSKNRGLASSMCHTPSTATRCTMKDMRQDRDWQLVESALKSGTSTSSLYDDFSSAPIWLCILGVLPWWSGMHSDCMLRWFTHVCRFFTSITISGIMIAHVYEIRTRKALSASMAFCLLDISLGLGCLIRLLSFWLSNDHVVGNPHAILTTYAVAHNFHDNWDLSSRRYMFALLFFWAGTVASCIFASLVLDWDIEGYEAILYFAAFAFITNMFAALIFNILHVCEGLSLMLDNFCGDLVVKGDCGSAVLRWNKLQAILRRACVNVARSYVLLLSSSLLAVFLPTVMSDSLLAIFPGACSLLVLIWLSGSISEVTSKCDRVPAFINTLDFGVNLDSDRQYVVTYIKNSRAGFYMFDIRFTREMVVKFTYVAFILSMAYASSRLSQQ